MSKRFFSFLLAMLMVLSTIPAVALGTSAETRYINVASGVIATTGRGGTTSSLTDGDTSGYYDLGYWGSTAGDPSSAYGTAGTCYVQLDLGAPKDVDKIDVFTLTDRDYRFVVYGTNDKDADISTWTKLCEKTEAVMMTADGATYTLDTPVSCQYIRAYGMYNDANVGFHFTEIRAWANVEIDENTPNILSIQPNFGGMENWNNRTQLLIGVNESELMGAGITMTADSLKAGIDAGTYSTQLVINGNGYDNKVMDLHYSSYAGYSTFRFEPCLAEDPFIPACGKSYTITLNVLDAEGNLFAYGTNKWTCPMYPMYIYDEGYDYETTYTYDEKDLGWYATASELHSGDLVILPQGFPFHYFGSTSSSNPGQIPEVEMIVGDAVYTVDLEHNYSWSSNVMARIRTIKEGFTPAPGTSYDATFKVYVNSYPSGEKTLVGTYTAKDFVLMEDMNDQIPYNYNFIAENGKIGVEFNAETSEYTLTSLPDEGYGFSHWLVDGNVVSEDAIYVFTAKADANCTITAVYEGAIAINWNINGETYVSYAVNGSVPTPPVTPVNYRDYCWEYTYIGWDKEIVAATEETTYTAQYSKGVCDPYIISVGKYGSNGMENWGGETQMLFYLIGDGTTVDMRTVWENRNDYRFEFTFTEKATGKDVGGTVVAPGSEIFGTTAERLAGRFTICAGPNDAFVPTPGVEYYVNVKVYDMTRADEIEGGFLFLQSNNTELTHVFPSDLTPITHNYYTVTWTQNGEVIATETWKEGLIPTAPVVESYIEDGCAYVLNTPVVEVTGDATYEITYSVTNLKNISLDKVYTGWENWSDNTQLLLKIFDYKGDAFTALWEEKDNYIWELTINGEKYIMAPSSEYLPWALYRFTPCVDSTFVPVPGGEYVVSLTIYEPDGTTVAYKSTNSVTTNFPADVEPIVPEPKCTHENVTVLEGYDATCTADGLTEGSVCADCGEIVVMQESIPALGHNYADGSCVLCGEADPDYSTEPWSWTLENGVLTITGTGAVTANSEEDYPWHAYRAEITEIVVGDGITEIGARAFMRCTALTKITYGKDVTALGSDAMSYNSALTTVVFNGPITSLGQGTVWVTSNIVSITITGQTKEEFLAVAAVKYYNDNYEKIAEWIVNGVETEEPTVTNGTIKPMFGAWENWREQTQLLVGMTGMPVDQGMLVDWHITLDDGETAYFVVMKASSNYNMGDTVLYRFETCIASESFVPVPGASYVVSVMGYLDGELVYVGTPEEGAIWTVPSDLVPIIPETECTHENVTVLEGYDATCTADGLTEGSVCADCGEIVVMQESIPALGHKYADGSCVLCGEADPDYIPEPPVEPEVPAVNITVVGVDRAMAGDIIEVQVLLGGNPGIAFLALTPVYDASVLTLVSVSNGGILSDMDHELNLIFSADTNTYAEGVLVTFTFLVAEDAPAGDYAVELIFRECYNEAYEEVSVAVENANVNIIDFIYGDVNGDLVINGKDVVVLRKYMANYDYDTGSSTVAVEAGADANGDGIVNGKDVVLLRKYMANYDYETGSSTVVLGPAA